MRANAVVGCHAYHRRRGSKRRVRSPRTARSSWSGVPTGNRGVVGCALTSTTLFQNTCSENLDLRCVLVPAPLVRRGKTRLHTPKAVTYHEQPHCCRFMIGHSLGRMESRLKKFKPLSLQFLRRGDVPVCAGVGAPPCLGSATQCKQLPIRQSLCLLHGSTAPFTHVLLHLPATFL